MHLNVEDIVWYNRNYDGIKPIFSCGDFHNVPLTGAKGGMINYNLVLSLRKLGYPLKDKPKDILLEKFVLDEGVDDPELLKRVRHAWGKVHIIRKKELGK